jgi:predicted transposase YbfD/YdcC
MEKKKKNNNIEIPKNTNVTIGTLTNRQFKEAKIQDRETDAFYKTDHKLEESKVSIPTIDAVVEAKEWVDNVSRL